VLQARRLGFVRTSCWWKKGFAKSESEHNEDLQSVSSSTGQQASERKVTADENHKASRLACGR
jgi:hypothetical protein